MELQASRKFKFFCLTMPILMVLGIFVSAGTSVYAEEFSEDKQVTLWDIEDDNEVAYDSSHAIQSRSKGGCKATRIIECKKYGNCKSPIKQIWDNAKKVWKKYH
ncbi:hypothetical protein HRD84_08620 [Enterococcus faecalis]|nr:hypothetical protein [Enterococcus faecalis]